ncbi:hypothetical protein [Croceimicrobium sp.]|uniref:hypothetical protein n=1 Tax=Croceimicrobium sp. TaxID=2828340 RepID=UPI003BAC6DFA
MGSIIGIQEVQKFANVPKSIDGQTIEPLIKSAQTFDLEPKIDPIMFSDLLGPIDNEARPELAEFKAEKVAPFLAYHVFIRMLTSFGRDLSPSGLIKPSDPRGTFQPADERDRSAMIRQAQSDLNVYETRLFLALDAAGYKFDGVQYVELTKKPKSGRKFKISAI